MNNIEKTLRDYMVASMAMQHAEFLELNDELELDSLGQTEIRIFVEEKYKVPVGLDEMKAEVTSTLNGLITYIDQNSKKH